jgi:hypothetical protein
MILKYLNAHCNIQLIYVLELGNKMSLRWRFTVRRCVYSGTGVTDDRNGSTYSFNPATAELERIALGILLQTLADVLCLR